MVPRGSQANFECITQNKLILGKGNKIADNMLEENHPLTAQCLMYIGLLRLEQAKENKPLKGKEDKIIKLLGR